jgi:hypothetical protein
MPTLTQAIATYSYINRPALDLGTIDLTNPDIALLTQINSLLASASHRACVPRELTSLLFLRDGFEASSHNRGVRGS